MPPAHVAAVERLRAAVEALPPVGEEQDPDRSGDDVWQVVCRGCIRGWVAAVERDYSVATSALRSSGRASGWDLRVRRFEEAVWRLVSLRDRLSAVLALALGTPVLGKKGEGVRFLVDGKKLSREIVALASGSDAAGRVLAAWARIDEHEAVDLRNTITHKVPSVTGIPPLAVVEDVYQHEGSPLAYEHSYLVGRKIGRGLDPDVLLCEGRESAKELLAALVEATLAVADLIVQAGALHPPRVCEYECDSNLRNCKLVSRD